MGEEKINREDRKPDNTWGKDNHDKMLTILHSATGHSYKDSQY